MNDLIDTTEMYLRTIFELEEEGIVPLRARIAERLHQSGPTVSQTVARMERDGLLTVEGDRHLQLSDEGRRLATAVMRKHRLAECLLVDVIGLDYADVHEEACRWEHVMSEAVERKLLALLGNPTTSPFGNPIPGLDALRGDQPLGGETSAVLDSLTLLSTSATAEGRRVTIRRISEQLQEDAVLLRSLADRGVPEQREQLALHRLAHDVLPPARLLMDVGVVQADHVHQEALGQPVLAHDGRGQPASLVGELQMAVALDGQQPVPLHPGDGLAHRGAALAQPLGDPRAQRGDPLLLQLEDGAEVHLGGVD